jgi:hypothetical protein
MNVSVYLLDAALSGDDLAVKQLNDILEEYKLNKIPHFNIVWDDQFTTSTCPLNFKYVVCISHKDPDRWLVYFKQYLIKGFDNKPEAKQFVEQEIKKKIYGRS